MVWGGLVTVWAGLVVVWRWFGGGLGWFGVFQWTASDLLKMLF